MGERKKYIENYVDSAEAKLKDAETLKEKYREKISDIEKYKSEQLSKIDLENINYKNEQIELLKEQIKKTKDEFLAQLESEKDVILEKMAAGVLLGVGDLLKDIFISLTSKSSEDAALEKFLGEIKNLPSSEIERLNNTNGSSIDFISGFELNDDQKSMIRNVFMEKKINCRSINFLSDNKMVLGSKIIASGLIIHSSAQNAIDQFNIKLKKSVSEYVS
jgi:F0F1-type ATP synthase membrane subunit b/b'